MDYAIIEHNELLEVLKLSIWESYENITKHYYIGDE